VTTSRESPTESPSSIIKELEGRLLSHDLSIQEHVDTLSNLAWELRRLDSQRCFDLAQEAYDLSEEHNYKHGLASSLLARSFAHFRLSAYDKTQKDVCSF